MRKCIATKPNTPSNDGAFHGFVTETNEDGMLVTLAIVEFIHGKVDTVPLSWIELGPMSREPEPAVAMQGVVDDFIYRIQGLINEAYSMFRR